MSFAPLKTLQTFLPVAGAGVQMNLQAADCLSPTSGMRPGMGVIAWQGPVVPAAPLRGFASPPANLSAPSGSAVTRINWRNAEAARREVI